jgi:hypothetical protein
VFSPNKRSLITPPQLKSTCCAEGLFPHVDPAEWKEVEFQRVGTTVHDLSCGGEIIKAFELEQLDEQQYVVYTSCAHNEEVSFNQRLAAETQEPSWNDIDWKLVEQIIDDLVERIRSAGYQPGKMDINDLMESRPGRLRRQYKRAYEQLADKGNVPIRSISRVQPFVKQEKMKPGKSPRLVMSRDKQFTLLMLMYSLPIEQAFSRLPQVGIGKNYRQRGQTFADLVLGEKMAKTDFTKFEASKRPLFRQCCTFRVYQKLLGSLYREFQVLQEETLKTRGHTLRGSKFTFRGCEISGDATTILDNTIDNWIMTRYFLLKNGMDGDCFNVVGDDGVMRVSHTNGIDTYAQFGFTIKLDYVYDYHDLDYCSSKFIQVAPGTFYQVQHLRTLLDKVQYMINPSFNHHLDDYYASVGYMYMQIYKGIPV